MPKVPPQAAVDSIALLKRRGREEFEKLLPSIQEGHDGWTVVIDLDPVWNDVPYVLAPTLAEAKILAGDTFGQPMIVYIRGICENSLGTEVLSMEFV